MAADFLTTTQVATFNDSDMAEALNDVLDDSPFLRVMAARTVPGNVFKYNKRTQAPSVGFRAENAGRDIDHTEYVSVTANLAILDASSRIDVAVAQADERGWSVAVADEMASHLKAAMFAVEQELFALSASSNGFTGFAASAGLDALADAMVYDATGSTANTASSVYGIRMGPGHSELLWGQAGEISIGDTSIQGHNPDGGTTEYPTYYTPITGWCGLKLGAAYSAGRIANLTEDSGKGLDDDKLAELIALFPAGQRPDYLVMGKRSHKQLRNSRTATNPTGQPAPFPSEAFGIPIVVTEAITATEAIET